MIIAGVYRQLSQCKAKNLNAQSIFSLVIGVGIMRHIKLDA